MSRANQASGHGSPTRRQALAGLLSIPAVATLSGCTSGVGTRGSASGLELLTYDEVEAAAMLREQLAVFDTQTGLSATLDTVPGSGAAQFPDKLRTRILGGQAPDIWRIWGGQIGGPFVDAGLTVELDDYYQEYGWDEMLSDIGITGMTFGGVRHGVPLNVASLGAWYNKEVFAAAGAEEPSTYDELENVNELILESGTTPAGVAGKYGWHIMRLFEFLLEVTAGPELHDALLLGEETWEDQAVVEAFDLFQLWQSRQWISRGALGIAPPDAEQGFVQGTTAYTLSGPWIENQYILASGRPPENYGTFLLPTSHDEVRHSGFVEGFMVSATTGQPDDAAELLDFLVQPDVQEALGNTQSATLDAPPDADEFPLSAKWAEIREHSSVYTIQDQAFPKAVSDQYFAIQSSILQGQVSSAEAAQQMQDIITEWRASQ